MALRVCGLGTGSRAQKGPYKSDSGMCPWLEMKAGQLWPDSGSLQLKKCPLCARLRPSSVCDMVSEAAVTALHGHTAQCQKWGRSLIPSGTRLRGIFIDFPQVCWAQKNPWFPKAPAGGMCLGSRVGRMPEPGWSAAGSSQGPLGVRVPGAPARGAALKVAR